MSKYTITIDPGHGASETGAVANGYIEKHLNLTVSLILEQQLKNRGFNVVMTRRKDSENPTLTQRGNIANNAKSDLFIYDNNLLDSFIFLYLLYIKFKSLTSIAIFTLNIKS